MSLSICEWIGAGFHPALFIIEEPQVIVHEADQPGTLQCSVCHPLIGSRRFDWRAISRLLKDAGWGFKPTMISKKHVIAWERGFSRRFALTLREFCVNQLCTVVQKRQRAPR